MATITAQAANVFPRSSSTISAAVSSISSAYGRASRE